MKETQMNHIRIINTLCTIARSSIRVRQNNSLYLRDTCTVRGMRSGGGDGVTKFVNNISADDCMHQVRNFVVIISYDKSKKKNYKWPLDNLKLISSYISNHLKHSKRPNSLKCQYQEIMVMTFKHVNTQVTTQ